MTASGRCSTLCTVALAIGLVAFFWRQGEHFLDANGPTFDECAHLAAGYGYWTTGDFRMNSEDPPLLKLWWALPLALGDRPAYPHDVAEASHGDHWQVGIALLYHSGVPHQSVLKPARRMNLGIGCGIVLLAGRWAFRLWRSRLAGLAAAAFAAFDPNLLALSCVLSTDAGFAFFALLSSYLLWEYAGTSTRPLLFALGISLGLMLGSKFSAIAMAAGLGAAGLVFLWRGGTLALPGERFKSRPLAAFDLAFRLGVIALIALAATYGFWHFDDWGRGLKFQLTRASHGDGRLFLNGELSKAGWYHYFLVVLAVKLSIGLMAAAIGSLPALWTSLGLVAPVSRLVFYNHRSGDRCHQTDASISFSFSKNRMVIFAIPPLVFLAAASFSRVDLGIRVVLPAVSFLYVLAGGWAGSGRCRIVRLFCLAGCLAWSGCASWQSAPYSISYFNEIAGDRGSSFVADSNVDWGQGLPALEDYMQRESIEIVYLSYFGTDRPEAYGIRFQALPGYGRVGPPGGEPIPSEAPRHVLAISVNNLLGIYLNDPDTYFFLRTRTSKATLAGSIMIFDLTDDDVALRLVRDLSIPLVR